MLRRVWAWLLDAVFIVVIAGAVWAVLFVLGVLTLGLGFVLMAVLPAIPLLYHVLFVSGARHATPGQRVLGLIVVRDADFGSPSLLQAVIFTGGLWLTLSVGVWPLLAALFTERHRALHDIVSGVVVVRAAALTPDGGLANMGVP